MSKSDKKLEEVVLTRLLHLNATVQGLVAGILLGLTIFVATNWLVLKGGPMGPDGKPVVGPHLGLLAQYFIGYRVTFLGSIVGFVYGFLVGFAGGYMISKIYNWLVDRKEHRSSRH